MGTNHHCCLDSPHQEKGCAASGSQRSPDCQKQDDVLLLNIDKQGHPADHLVEWAPRAPRLDSSLALYCMSPPLPHTHTLSHTSPTLQLSLTKNGHSLKKKTVKSHAVGLYEWDFFLGLNWVSIMWICQQLFWTPYQQSEIPMLCGTTYLGILFASMYVCACLWTDVSHLSRELSRVCCGGERDSLLSESQQS